MDEKKRKEIEEKDKQNSWKYITKALEFYKLYMQATTEIRIKVDILLDSNKAAEYLQIISETMKGE